MLAYLSQQGSKCALYLLCIVYLLVESVDTLLDLEFGSNGVEVGWEIIYLISVRQDTPGRTHIPIPAPTSKSEPSG